ncbi:peroxiredoxin [Lutibacter sp.]|uniref:peroxiredoxin n=1 Tax=Lutibacter sp. TaxID=1925666 RepID=UPI0035665796
MKKIFFAIIAVIGLLFLLFLRKNNEMNIIEVGDKVPNFILQDQNGKTFNLESELGSKMVIYFYPKNNTPACTKEACKFRDEYESFTDLDVKVIGISSDSVASHKKFEEKYNLPFLLLADIDNKVRGLFGVPKSMIFLPGRVTYVIDKNGIVRYIFNNQFGAEKHIVNALKKIKEL